MGSAQSLRRFFHYMGIVAVLSAYNTDLSHVTMIEVVKNVTMTFMFNLIVGIPGGLSWMFGMDLYLYIKKYTVK